MTLALPDLLCRSHFFRISSIFFGLSPMYLGQYYKLHILCLCARINDLKFQGYLTIYREWALFFLYWCKTTGMRHNKDLIHTSEDWASSSSQCSEFIPSGISLLNLHSNGKLKPFLEEARKKNRSQPFLTSDELCFLGGVHNTHEMRSCCMCCISSSSLLFSARKV